MSGDSFKVHYLRMFSLTDCDRALEVLGHGDSIWKALDQNHSADFPMANSLGNWQAISVTEGFHSTSRNHPTTPKVGGSIRTSFSSTSLFSGFGDTVDFWAKNRPQLLVVWLVVSTHRKKISQIGSFPQVRVKIKNVWNHHPVVFGWRTIGETFSLQNQGSKVIGQSASGSGACPACRKGRWCAWCVYSLYTYTFIHNFLRARMHQLWPLRWEPLRIFHLFGNIDSSHERKSNIKDFWFTIFMQKVCCWTLPDVEFFVWNSTSSKGIGPQISMILLPASHLI